MRSDHDHSPQAIRERLSKGPSSSYLRDWVYGGIDGAVTTFAVVTGGAGVGGLAASLSYAIGLLLRDLATAL